jgi:hypothetical protein
MNKKILHWFQELKEKLCEKYVISDIDIGTDGLDIFFRNGFQYKKDIETIIDYYYLSISDIKRKDDGFDFLCKDIERKYMEELKNEKR